MLVRSPSREGVGLGVCNRLYRAAGFRFISPGKGIITGITGGSGSGKSMICELLRKKGCVIIDADKIARSVTEKGSPVIEELALAFGQDIVLPDGNIDRRLLASRAFTSDESKRLLDSITLGRIVALCKEKAEEETEQGRNVIIDAPLLFTSGLWSICHRTVKIFAPVDVRLERILRRDGISREEALKRFSRQTEEDRESQAADIVINNYPPYDTEQEINKYF